jgi:hypothetical protein
VRTVLRWGALAGLLALVGCGGAAAGSGITAPDGQSLVVVRAAFAATVGTGSARITQRKIETGTSDSALLMDARGDLDFHSSALQLTESLHQVRLTFTFVVVHDQLYHLVTLPPGQDNGAGKRRWVQMDAFPAPILGDLFGGLVERDPVSSFTAFADHVRSAHMIGREDVRGRASTHFHGAVDTGRNFDVWVDDAGRIVRIRQPIEESASLSSAGQVPSVRTTRSVVTTELDDFGAQVHIGAPSPDETCSVSSTSSRVPPCSATVSSGAGSGS